MEIQDALAATVAADMATSAATQRPHIKALCVFAAGRRSFEVAVRWDTPMRWRDVRSRALSEIFWALPLAANGWREDSTLLSLVARLDGQDAIWRVSRAAPASENSQHGNTAEGSR